MKARYSIFSLARNALSYHENWTEAWRSPEPQPDYDVVIVGGGGHGLATAYYLAKEHGITNVAVMEKGWIGGGNTGRNTTIVRSNYLWDEIAQLYEQSMKLWEGLSQDLNYNVMFSQRGVINLAHTLQDMRDIRAPGQCQPAQRRRCARCSTPAEVQGALPDHRYLAQHALSDARRLAPASRRRRAPRRGRLGLCARAPTQRGVDIVQNCEVTGIRIERWPGQRASRPAGASSAPSKVGCRRRRPFERAGDAWRASACRSRAIRCRRSSPSRSSRCSTPSSCRTPCTATSASPTRAIW